MTLLPDTPELRKARGAFFTPPDLCRFVVEWAVRDAGDRVLEPSCGEAEFLVAAADRLAVLGADRPALAGHELHVPSAQAALERVRARGHDADVRVGDFFAIEPDGSFDAVVGNPPYVRYQDFAGDARARARAAALRGGVALTALASSWAAFTVHAALFLRPGGRLGLVVPAELLSVNYAAGVRRFLLERFGRVQLVAFTERVFPGVQEEVVLLLAEGEGPTDRFDLVQAHGAKELLRGGGVSSTWRPVSADDKWTAALLPTAALEQYASAHREPGVVPLDEWGDTTLGGVTGNNSWFTMSRSRARGLGLGPQDVTRISPPGSRHLRRLAFTQTDWDRLEDADARCLLFRPRGDPSPAARAYIADGEAAAVNEAYKCRVRKPWWQVPLPGRADLLLTYMNADTPRLATNDARVHHLNSVHGVYLRPAVHPQARRLLPLASVNTLTMLGAETIGRAYGGGLLKLEPGEADRLPVPSPALILEHAQALTAVRGAARRALAGGDLAAAVQLVDEIVLTKALGLAPTAVEILRGAHAALTARRMARSGSPRE